MMHGTMNLKFNYRVKEISRITELWQFFPIQFKNYLRIRLKNYFSHLSQRLPCS